MLQEEGRGQRKDKLKTPLTIEKRGRFPPPFAAPVVLECQSSCVQTSITFRALRQAESKMKECSRYQLLPNKPLQNLWLKTTVVYFILKSAVGQDSAGPALLCCMSISRSSAPREAGGPPFKVTLS